MLTNKIVTSFFGVDGFAVVRSVPKEIIVGSDSDDGPDTVEVISHHVQPETEATWTAPHAYLVQSLTCAVSVLFADRIPSNSLLVGTFA